MLEILSIPVLGRPITILLAECFLEDDGSLLVLRSQPLRIASSLTMNAGHYLLSPQTHGVARAKQCIIKFAQLSCTSLCIHDIAATCSRIHMFFP